MVSTAPDPVDVVDFRFREHLRLAVFKPSSFGEECNLVTVASRYGLIFVAGESTGLQVVQVKDIENLSKDVVEFKRRIVPLPSRVLHISVNCDSTKLAVVIVKDNCPHAFFYDVLSFLGQNIKMINHTSLSQNPQAKVIQIDWNPALPDVFTAVKSDGSLLLYEFKGAPAELPPAAGATCFCWSPKGKQLAVGGRDGRITQYKIDLKAVKVVEAPPDFTTIVSLCWVSSFQFFGVYNNTSGESCLICVDAPKTGRLSYTNFYDVCFSNGDARPQQFYLLHQMHWNVLYVASSNSMEIAILGMEATGKWTQWNLNDNSRAALPLGPKQSDTLPIGFAFNVGVMKFMDGEDVKQAPSLCVLSDHGALVIFNAINSRPGAMDICTPLENIPDRSGESLFLIQSAQNAPQPAVNAISTPTTAPPIVPPAVQLPTLPGLTIKPVAAAPNPTLFNSTMVAPIVKPLNVAFGQPAPSSTPLFGLPASSKPQAKPITAPSIFQHSAVVTTTMQSVSKPVISIPSVAPVTPDTPPVQAPPIQTQVTPDQTVRPSTEKLPITEETETMIADLVREECAALEVELRDLLQRGEVTTSYQIGSDQEMGVMARNAQEMETFYDDIKETINAHDTEVYTLKQCLMKTWACFEEARARYTSVLNPVTKVLLQSMPLDPAAQERRDEIARMIYYIDSQLMQANQSLDEQWDAFQDAMMKSSKLQLPTMESVYQSMVQHCKTVQRQRYMLQHIQTLIKASNRAKDRTLLNMSHISDNVEVEQLQEELSRLQFQQAVLPKLYNRLIERQSRLNSEKVRRLQTTLGNREASRVSVSKPQLNNSSVQLTTLFSAQLSPIAKKPQAQHIGQNMVISTPKPQVTKLLLGVKPEGSLSSLFTRPSTGSTTITNQGSMNLFRAPSTVANSASTPLFRSGSVVPVPGTGNTTSGAVASGTSSGTSKGFSFSTSSLPVSTSGGIFKPPTSTTASGFSFANVAKPADVKPKPALLATPTTPPVGIPSIFSGVTSAGAKTTGLLTTSTATAPTSSFATSTATPPTTNAPWNFGKTTTASAPAPTSTSTGGGLFGMSGNLFGAPSSTSGTAATATAPWSFGASSGTTQTQVPAKGTIFGGSADVATSTAVSSTGGMFGGTISVGTSTNPAVGSDAATATSTTPASNVTATTATTKTLFGSFGMSAASTTTTITSGTATSAGFGFGGGLFGTAANAGTSIFGSTPAATTTTNTTTESTSKTVTAINLATTTSAVTSKVGTAVTGSTGLLGTSPASTAAPTIVPAITIPAAATVATTIPPASTTAIFPGTTTTTSSFKSIFGASGGTTTTSPMFGGSTASTTASPSIFASGATTAFGKPAGTSIFGAAPTPASTTSTTSAVSTTGTPTTPVFGSTAPPAFGATATTTPSTTPFGPGSTSGQSNFGVTAPTSQPPAFGAGSVFGKPAFSTASAFGDAATNTSAASPFGAASTTTSSASSPFGTTAAGATSPFAAMSNTATTSAFGFSSGNLFAAPAKFASSGIFGGAATPTTTAASGPFGGAATGGSVFGGGTTTTGASSPFGAAPPAGGSGFAPLSNSPFAQSTPAQGTFGSPPAFGSQPQSPPAFGTSSAAPATTSASNAFSGFGSLSMGGGGSTFGQPAPTTPAANPFGAKTEQKPFGSSMSSNLFATPAPSGQSNQNIFGAKPAQPFGATSFGGGSGFGQQSTFGSPSSFGSTAGSGAFSGGGSQSVQQTGFGSPGSFQKPSGFGSPAVFGNQQPAFGGGASFGAAPTFGGGATFGSPGKVFGSSGDAPAAPFGSTGAQSSFGSIAQQDTVGFGNLAQQAATPTSNMPFSGGSSFTNWRN